MKLLIFLITCAFFTGNAFANELINLSRFEMKKAQIVEGGQVLKVVNQYLENNSYDSTYSAFDSQSKNVGDCTFSSKIETDRIYLNVTYLDVVNPDTGEKPMTFRFYFDRSVLYQVQKGEDPEEEEMFAYIFNPADQNSDGTYHVYDYYQVTFADLNDVGSDLVIKNKMQNGDSYLCQASW